MFNITRKTKKSIVCLLAILFLFTIFHFTIFESTHLVHKCTGSTCEICHELHMADTFTKQITSVVFAALACFFLIAFAKQERVTVLGSKSERNLVRDKVRIDD